MKTLTDEQLGHLFRQAASATSDIERKLAASVLLAWAAACHAAESRQAVAKAKVIQLRPRAEE